MAHKPPMGDWVDYHPSQQGVMDFDGAAYGQQYQGQGYGELAGPTRSVYFRRPPPTQSVPSGALSQLAAAKQQAAAQAASENIRLLPNGKAGISRNIGIDGSTQFGNSPLVAVSLAAANVALQVNTYTVQTGYEVVLDPQDPMQQVMIQPRDSAVAPLFIDGTVTVDVAEASTGDGHTVYQGQTTSFDPARNFAAGDRFRQRWPERYIAEAGDLIRTFLRLPSVTSVGGVAYTTPLSVAASRLAHTVRVWKLK